MLIVIFIFCFRGKATGATAFFKQWNRHHPEAVVVHFQKLVAVSRSWWHPEAGGIRRLVAAGMPPLPWLGWLFSFFSPGSMRITIPRCHQVGFLFFVFVARQQAPPLFFNNETGITRKLWWSVSRSWWQFPEAGGIRRLVASGGWWHPEAGGIWRLVVVGMPPLPWLGWLFSFFATRSLCHCNLIYLKESCFLSLWNNSTFVYVEG